MLSAGDSQWKNFDSSRNILRFLPRFCTAPCSRCGSQPQKRHNKGKSMKKFILWSVAILTMVTADLSAKTTSSGRSRSWSSGKSSWSSSPKPSTPPKTSSSGFGWSSSKSTPKVSTPAPVAPKPSSSLSSGLNKLSEKNIATPMKTPTAVPAPKPSAAPSTKSYYSSPPRAPTPEAVKSVPAGREMRYEPGRGYGYMDSLGTFMIVDAISDAASTAILANALSDKDNRVAETRTNSGYTTTAYNPTTKQESSSAGWVFMGILGLVVLGVVLTYVLKSR